MASSDPSHVAARYCTDESLEVIVVDDFGLSNGKSSEEEKNNFMPTQNIQYLHRGMVQ